uniref:Macaca fascicularis brain cDNA clone: QflA-17269, similar to human syntaxin 12 (STX12), mRNA, RefSeq: NM_177424.1 n=1 Tax=Macaca fascicularis TaxID=9541 RepID=I7GL93_MACFA|nr:unnamed protein product [Macaca fascicularis]
MVIMESKYELGLDFKCPRICGSCQRRSPRWS